MSKKQRLELTWIGKDEEVKLEPRILIEDAEKSCGDKKSENMLIFGDNLLALKALEQDFAGKIKCICIDPPYNTGSAFEKYDDGLEHSIWLSLIRERLSILHGLLTSNGLIYIQIDDREYAYLKIVCDEIFGRGNFICTFIWEARSGQGNTVGHIAEFHEYILCYAKDTNLVNFKKRENITGEGNFKDNQGSYKREQLRQWGQQDKREDRPSMYYPVKAPNGTEVFPKRPDGTDGRWRCSKEKMDELLKAGNVDFVKDADGNLVCYKKIRAGKVSFSAYGTLLTDIGTASTATKELKQLFKDKVFDTPKPENLIRHLLEISTDSGDIVLDSFLGSGTTAAVAHKMGRKWIGVELGEHCHTVVIPRLKAVIDGEQGGISKLVPTPGPSQEGIPTPPVHGSKPSKAGEFPSREGIKGVGWKGGGGFKYYYLAPSLLKQDKYKHWVIDEQYNANMLAAAMAKHEGFKYSPDETVYWKQGKSTEKDYIYTTTQFMTGEMLDKIHEELADGESLLICCKSFQQSCVDRFPDITVKKIPNILLGRCEFGKKNYNLNIINPPVIDDEEYEDAAAPEPKKSPPRRGNKGVGLGNKPKLQTELF